jgi:heavy metal efflux system protein
MINKLIQYSIHNKLIIGLGTLVLIFTGLWSITKVPLDAVPDITNNQVQVITQSPNLGTEDIEQFVTYPVEVAMANLPGVTEIRSISRFGLSVVTVVFEDGMGTYLPRQLVSEKLNEVKKEIPPGFGEPSMGPISTGLGEIYQYTLKVEPEYKDVYSLADLRSMQDWIISRQMAMVPGVVEINAIGGNTKQYEVAVNPEDLNAIGVTILEVFNALEVNNQNTGGAYIEKDHQANFIRGEGLARSLEDIENIVIKNVNGRPITIKDVAKVQFGAAVKYGALTQDGEGEVVGGMIMMLKNANSNDVIKAAKERMDEIQKSLPDGVWIDPLLDRSTLIAKTTGTVSTNLMEGALIVIFVLVFLLGNWRGGIIVASTIPLSLLFAFILMNIFGVWANLMSLGAIDFGIIIDGAVIIVESTVFLLMSNLKKTKKIGQEERDEIAFSSSSKMMNAAFFGQLIILIVFIPILALEGVEGKMFIPMALTFMFAMIGVMLLCLTYVPMMSALFLRIGKRKRVPLGDRFVHWIEEIYGKLLIRALSVSKIVVGVALTALTGAILLFSTLGGEFVPQLDEGDLAFHAILKPGSSLKETVKTTTRIEKIIKDQFPEVEKIVSRIGVAEVPTDPMPMDIADVFVILKPKSEWVSADSKDDLIMKMKEAIEVVPGVNYEFTQPIEMRFNELLEGVREDIAIKIYGEDVKVLAEIAQNISEIIAGTPGIGDMKVEATTGLPQMTVRYDRFKVAQYGLQINDLNAVVESAFAGGTAGVIFEGEKRFDLVVRFDTAHRKSIEDLRNLYVTTYDGSHIPLKEVAYIDYEPGPMQISRDNTNRRTYVGINVRGRDVKSLVEEIQGKLDKDLDMPTGYYLKYGGAFENLERATKRLLIVVPISLAMIFILIFFALKSVKQATMIYMAIPLAAIGGVFSLWLRGMPFSISAGVGFIVLFGVAVLNGLVLISGWNELKEEGMDDLDERIRLGAKRRIRPIMLTALTDVLGFLPMAISTSAGAEVQQPLATVVIGGMISATLLTLFVLPILYRWTEGGRKKRSKKKVIVAPAIMIAFLLIPTFGISQDNGDVTTLDQLTELGKQHNGSVLYSLKGVDLATQNKKASFNLGKTNVLTRVGQMNGFNTDVNVFINQKFSFPTVYFKQRNLAMEKMQESEIKYLMAVNQLNYDLKKSWLKLAYLHKQKELLDFKDSLFQEFYRAAQVRYDVQESEYLELITAETQLMAVQNELAYLSADIEIVERELNTLIGDSVVYNFSPEGMAQRPLVDLRDSSAVNQNPLLQFTQQQINIAKAEKSVNKAKFLPDFTLGYFNQSIIGTETSSGGIATASDRFQGAVIGISIPLFYGSYRSKVKSSAIHQEMSEINADYSQRVLQTQYEQQLQELIKNQLSIDYYTTKALPQSDLIIQNTELSFLNGAIDFIQYFASINQAIELKVNYFKTLSDYNQAVIQLEFLIGQ